LSLAGRNKGKKNKKKQRRWLPGWDHTLPTTITIVIVCMKDLVTFFFFLLFWVVHVHCLCLISQSHLLFLFLPPFSTQ
jgi:hypothetical protein